MSAHTPGPWELHLDIGYFNSLRVCVPDPTTERGCRAVGEAEILGMPRAEAEANARLMATSPELLAELKTLVAEIERLHLPVPFARLAIATGVIAKAEGR